MTATEAVVASDGTSRASRRPGSMLSVTAAPTVRTVADVMSSPVVTALPDETVAAAAARMSEPGVGSVVVVDGDRPIGILTERDIVRFAAAGPSAAGHKVAEWMTADPDCVDPTCRCRRRSPRSAEHGYRHIPVVDDGDLVGVVSMRDLMRVAAIQPVVHPGQIEAPPGLEGVIVAETKVGDVRGHEGFYHYRQYSAVELAAKRSLEDIWYLLFEGELPSAAESTRLRRRDPGLRTVPECGARAAARPSPRSGGPIMDQLRSAVSLIGHSQGFRPWLDIPARELRANALQRVRRGADAHHGAAPPRAGPGADRPRPRPGLRRQLPVDADRRARPTPTWPGPSSSTRSSRSTTGSTPRRSPPGSSPRPAPTWRGAVTGGIGALSGPLHGGAPSRALDLLDAIGTPENARPYLVDAVTHGEKIMGFGHRVYKTDDPRSVFLRERGRAHRGREGRVRQAGRADGRRRARRAEARPQPLRQRRVLRRRRDGALRAAAATCSARRSPRAGSSAGAPTSSSRRPTTGSSARRPATWARRRRSPCPTHRADRDARPRSVRPGEGRDRHHAHARHRRRRRAAGRPALAVEPAAHDGRAGRASCRRRPPTCSSPSTTTARSSARPRWSRSASPPACGRGSRTWSSTRPAAGRGSATALTDAMVDRARELGRRTVDLTSRPSREAANRLYQRVGFVAARDERLPARGRRRAVARRSRVRGIQNDHRSTDELFARGGVACDVRPTARDTYAPGEPSWT